MKKATESILQHWHNNSHAAYPPVTVNPPVYRGSTVLFRDYAEMCQAGRGELKGPVYGTDRFPVQRSLEEAMQKLENGAACRVFPSGLSAIQNTFLAFCKSGDHVLMVDNAYHPGISFCQKILAKFNIETTFIPPAIGAEIEDYIRDNTRLILLESPGSNTFEIQDIPLSQQSPGKKTSSQPWTIHGQRLSISNPLIWVSMFPSSLFQNILPAIPTCCWEQLQPMSNMREH